MLSWKNVFAGSRRFFPGGLLLALLVGLPLTGQVEPAPPPLASPPAPVTIDLARVPAAAAELEQNLSDFTNQDNRGLINEIEIGLPEIQATILQASRRLVNIREHSVSAQRVVAVRTSLNTGARQLDLWQSALTDSISRTDRALAELTKLSALWTGTRDQAIADAAPGTLITQLRASLSTINRTRDRLEERRNLALEMQGDVGIELRRISRIDAEIESLMAQSRAALMRPNSPPLWEVFTARESESVMQDLERYLTENTAVLGHWARQHLFGLFVWGASFGLVLGVILSARRRHLDALEADDRLQTATTLAKLPFSTSVLIALLLVPLILRERTEAFAWITTVLAVPALLRLIPTLIPEHARSLARGATAIYVLVRLAYLFPESSNPARLLYVVSEVIIVIGAIRFLRHASQTGARGPLLHTIVRIMAALAAVAFGAHLLGYSLLGATLIQGAATSAFLGLALISVSSVAAAFFRLLVILGPLQHLQSVKLHYGVMEAQVRRGLFWFTLVLWFLNSLRGFTAQEFVFTWVGGVLEREWQFGSITLTLGALGWFVLSIWIAVLISRVLRFFLENDVLAHLGLPRGVPSTISMMLHYGSVSLGFVVALAALGVELSQLSIMIGALGVGIGFGLQNIVNNIISGLILVFERPISVGDVVQFGTTMGKVTRIGLRSSVVRDFAGAEIIVPNGNLISDQVTNWTLSDEMRRIKIPIHVPFETDADTVIALLEKTAREHELVAADPAPWAVLEGFGESALQFSIRCWAHSSEFLKAKSSLTVELDRALKQAGIKIPYPQRDLHLPDRAKTAAPAAAPPADESE